MKTFAAIAVAAFAAIASAQDASDLPQCSLPCFVQAIGPTGCQVFDFDCQCQAANQNSIRASVTPCVLTSCATQAELLQVIQVTYEICQAHGGVVGGLNTVTGIPASDLSALSTAFPQALGTGAASAVASSSAAVASSSSAAVPVYGSSSSAVMSSAMAATSSAYYAPTTSPATPVYTPSASTTSSLSYYTGAAASMGVGFGAVAAAFALAL